MYFAKAFNTVPHQRLMYELHWYGVHGKQNFNKPVDFPEYKIRLFPDDCIVYRYIHNQQNAKFLQKSFNAIQAWTSAWLINFLNIARYTLLKL